MELMSSLLFCAFATMLPQTLGDTPLSKTAAFATLNQNSTMEYRPNYLLQKKLLLNLNGPPLVRKCSALQTVFTDPKCIMCISCMERAIKAYKKHTKRFQSFPTSRELNEDLLSYDKGMMFSLNSRKVRSKGSAYEFDKKDVYSHHDLSNHSAIHMPGHLVVKSTNNEDRTSRHKVSQIRNKRQIDLYSVMGEQNQDKKFKPNNYSKKKKFKTPKVAVTKYINNGEIYALKLKESRTSNSTVCQVYKVVNVFPCGSLHGDMLTNTLLKEKTNNKIKKKFSNKIRFTAKKNPNQKRETRGFVSKENVWSSMEELIY